MEITIALSEPDIVLTRLKGSLDISGAANIESELRGTVRHCRNIVADLTDVSFVSSQGVRILVATAKAAHAKGVKMVLAGPNPAVRKILDFMSISLIIPIFDTVDSAKHGLSA